MSTELITSVVEMKACARRIRAEGRKLGLVPTMGALHEGHLSLVRRAKQECDAVTVSIFVNPTQFGPEEDLARYPGHVAADLVTLGPLNVDFVFAPSAADMYPPGFATFVESGEAAALLEGACRPGHFRGVATVVLKLFNIVTPDVAYFGQKDFQQTAVVRQLIEDLNLQVRLVVGPTVREPDGLAASSRNAYLSASDRKAAVVLHRSLRRSEELFQAGETKAEKVLDEMRAVFAAEPRVKLEYAALVEPVRLEPVELITPGCVALVAARLGTARLIDNVVLGREEAGAAPEPLDRHPEVPIRR